MTLEEYADASDKLIETLKDANAELKKENELAKSLLYCTKRTCDNCGFVTCENFQRQRKSEPCALYISYQDRIKKLAHETDVLRENLNDAETNLASVSEQLTEAKQIIRKLLSFIQYDSFNIDSINIEQKAEAFLKE